MNRKIFAYFPILLGLLAGSLPAVKVKIMEKSSFRDFQKGSFQNVAIASTGKIALGPRFRLTTSPPSEEYFLSLDVGRGGDTYVGTGHNCSVFKLNPAGNPERVFKGEHLDVYALVVAGNNDLIVGTSPTGKVYRVSAKDKKVTELFDPEERFIWDLREDLQGNIICATGNTGGIYSISPTGQVDQIFTGEDSHIVSLYITSDNTILAGSGDRGVLYQIKNRKVKVLFDSNLDEIRGICEDGEGNIYFAAIKGMLGARTVKDFEFGPAFRKSRSDEKPEIKEKSVLYRIKPDGVTEQVWSSEEEYIYSLYYHAASRSVIMGTGNSGRMYRVEANGDYSLIVESDSAQVFKIVGNTAGFLALANNSAAILQVENGWSTNGIYYSDVLDAKIASRFGRLNWTAEAPAGTSISMAVRTGNSDNPDSSWTPWSAPFMDNENSTLSVSGYRFLQIRTSLASQSPNVTPTLAGFRIHYLESNIAPSIREILIDKGNGDEKKPKAKEAEEPPHKYLRISWMAFDPNQDTLLFNVYLRKVTDKEWLPVQKNLTEKNFLLNSEIYEDGKYWLKVEADDSLDNAPSMAKSVSLVSSSFLIDSTAPTLRDWVRTGTAIGFTVNDETSAIRQVLYSFDGKLWFSLFPEDLVADSRMEKFNVAIPDLSKHPAIFIKVMDEFDNSKVYQKEL